MKYICVTISQGHIHLPPPQKREGLLRWAMLNTAESVLKDGVLGI